MGNNAEWIKGELVGIHFKLEHTNEESHKLARAYQFLRLQVAAPFVLGSTQ
jgi:hypothetical protein